MDDAGKIDRRPLLSRLFFKCSNSRAVTRDLERKNTEPHPMPLKHPLNLPSMIHLQLQ